MINPKVITYSDPASIVAEAYRVIRSNIQFSNPDRVLKRIVITSYGSMEGKTLTISNLAVAYAYTGKKILLVDADLRKPKVAQIFGMGNDCGLSNLLSGYAQYQQCIKSTVVKNLHILPGGPASPNPSEMLGSDEMVNLLNKLDENYDIILLDTPPVGFVTDAQILSTICSGVVLVVASKQTDTNAALQAKSLLESVNANIIGVILNRTKADEKASKYIERYL